jgi:hypothetical protein
VEIAWTNNVSVEALWLRLLTPLTAMQHPGVEWSPITSTAAIIAARLSEVVLVLLSIDALRRLRRRSSRHPENTLHFEFAMLVLLLLLIMRLTWVHTLAAVLFVYPLLMHWGVGSAVQQHRAGVVRMAATSLAFFLGAAHLPVLWEHRWMTWPWLLAPGLHTIGLLAMWGLCVWALRDSAQLPGMTKPRVL